MADSIQCDNCGATLDPQDKFCGECGAPRPSLVSDVPAAGLPSAPAAPARPLPPPAAKPSGAPDPGWRAAFLILLILGGLSCLVGLAAFTLFGSIGGDGLTPQENWSISGLCCLLPIGGLGAILIAAGITVWYSRLRNR